MIFALNSRQNRVVILEVVRLPAGLIDEGEKGLIKVLPFFLIISST
jgi:hypothetical protein